jgi:uncharacterized membrane protein SirB2
VLHTIALLGFASADPRGILVGPFILESLSMYFMVKHFHLTCVALSLSLLFIRFFWMLRQSPQLEKKWVKVLPHIVDTFLLLSAMTLCVIISQYPFVNDWLTEKFFAVIAYIIMGYMCLKGRTATLRWVSFAGALGWIALIGRLAVTKQPLF